jgi:glycosyltransferase involved in cell wall biosynthesis
MAPLKVAVVADVLLTPMGGVARSVWGIVQELAQLDPERIDLTVVAKRKPQALNGTPFRRSRAPKVPRLPDQVFALQRPFTLHGYDVVHYIDSRPPVTLGLGRGPLEVVTQHGFATLMWPEDYSPAYLRLNRLLLKIAPHADLTFTASESERREILDRVSIPEDRIVAIHHGVDHHRFFPNDVEAAREDVRRRFGIEGRYVLYVSNHQRKKNTERLVEAFGLLAADDPDITLVLTGWHSPKFALVQQRISDLGLQERVKVLGHVPDDALPPLYTAASVFALPSLHEGFGIPVLEAMACETPVVASDVYALAEVCGDAAELCDPYSVESIAGALRRVLSDPARAAELREKGLARASEFSWQRAAERHLECYEQAVARRR